jgi:hypothetical protein
MFFAFFAFFLCLLYGKHKIALLLSYFSTFYWGFVSENIYWLKVFGKRELGS